MKFALSSILSLVVAAPITFAAETLIEDRASRERAASVTKVVSFNTIQEDSKPVLHKRQNFNQSAKKHTRQDSTTGDETLNSPKQPEAKEETANVYSSKGQSKEKKSCVIF